MKEFNYLFNIADAKRKLFDKDTQPLSWGYQEGRFEAFKEIKEWLHKHETEIRKQAKQEVVEELLSLVNTLGIIRKSKSFVNGYDFAQEQIKQKLNEMKGGSNE